MQKISQNIPADVDINCCSLAFKSGVLFCQKNIHRQQTYKKPRHNTYKKYQTADRNILLSAIISIMSLLSNITKKQKNTTKKCKKITKS